MVGELLDHARAAVAHRRANGEPELLLADWVNEAFRAALQLEAERLNGALNSEESASSSPMQPHWTIQTLPSSKCNGTHGASWEVDADPAGDWTGEAMSSLETDSFGQRGVIVNTVSIVAFARLRSADRHPDTEGGPRARSSHHCPDRPGRRRGP